MGTVVRRRLHRTDAGRRVGRTTDQGKPEGRRRRSPRMHEKIRVSPAAVRRARLRDPHIMDIERINAIGTTLHDLKARTDALRGYL